MEHAYLILAHKNPVQLIQLISALQAENSYFFVHIDGKSENVYDALRYSKLPPNVFLCENRKNVFWGGFSQVESTMLLIDMLIHAKLYPDYVHLISGQDLPLKTTSEIDAFFTQNKGKNFLNYFTLPCTFWAGNGGLDRILYTWRNTDEGRGVKSPLTESFPKGLRPYGGSQWWSLTMDCINYLHEVCRAGNPIYDFYRHALIPDEMIFQTIIMNSDLSTSTVNDNLRHYDWETGPEHPRIFTIDDFDKITRSGKIFARKFDIDKDAAVIDLLFQQIRNLD